MSLRRYVADYIRGAELRPTKAGSPEEIEGLKRALDRDWDGSFAALHAPISVQRWEEQVLLHKTDPESDGVTFVFPYEMMIVGMRPSLSVIQPIQQGDVVPTLDDIQVSINVNETELLTKMGKDSLATSGGIRGGNFITLASVGVQVPCLFGMKLTAPKPNIEMTFRWKQESTFKDTLIAVTMYVKPLHPHESANVTSQYEL
jgi:hypothetical protein